MTFIFYMYEKKDDLVMFQTQRLFQIGNQWLVWVYFYLFIFVSFDFKALSCVELNTPNQVFFPT